MNLSVAVLNRLPLFDVDMELMDMSPHDVMNRRHQTASMGDSRAFMGSR